MNWTILLEHVQLGIILGTLTVGIIEFFKDWLFPNVKGTKLRTISILLTVVFAFGIGYFYTEASLLELGLSVFWTVVGAQSTYAIIQKLTQVEVEEKEEV